MRETRPLRLVTMAVAAALLVGACTGEKPETTTASQERKPMVEAPSTDTGAATLRATLNTLLQEHPLLAAAATGAALGGREDEFQAAADALDGNSVALSEAVGSVYGQEAGDQFLELWRSHIGMFVEYATAVAEGDRGGQDKAVQDLQGYTEDFGAFLASANPNLTKDAVAALVLEHVLGLKEVVDAQAAEDPATAYAALRDAAGHMAMIADPLAAAIVAQFPGKFA